MAVETDIMAALMARVDSLALMPGLPVAKPNVAYSPPANHRYARVVFIPNVANRLLLGSNAPHQHLGLLQISVYGALNQGEQGVRADAAAVAAHFPCDLKLTSGAATVRITKRPDVRDMLVEKTAVQIPVMISWECFG